MKDQILTEADPVLIGQPTKGDLERIEAERGEGANALISLFLEDNKGVEREAIERSLGILRDEKEGALNSRLVSFLQVVGNRFLLIELLKTLSESCED